MELIPEMAELRKLPPSILSVNRTWDLLTHKERNNVCRTWGQQLRPGYSLSHRISMEPGPQFPESSFYTQTAENMSYVDLSFLPCLLGHSDGSGLDGLSVPIGYSLTLLVTRHFPRGPSPCLRGLKPACIHPMFLKASTSGRGHRLSQLMDQCLWRVHTGSGILKVSQDSHRCWGPAWSHGAIIPQSPEPKVCNYPLTVTLKAGGGVGRGKRVADIIAP